MELADILLNSLSLLLTAKIQVLHFDEPYGFIEIDPCHTYILKKVFNVTEHQLVLFRRMRSNALMKFEIKF